MSLRKTLVLAVVLCAVLGYIFKVELPAADKAVAAGKLLHNVQLENVNSLEISKAERSFILKNNQPKVVEVKRDQAASAEPDFNSWKSWSLADIAGSQLDRSNLQVLVNALIGVTLENPLSKEDLDSDLSVYGLKEPQLRLKIVADKIQRELLIGKENQYLNQRYAKLADRAEIYMLAESVFEAANKSKDDFRNKAPIDFAESNVKEFSVDSGVGELVKLKSDDNYVWRVSSPADYSASNAALSDFGRELRAAKVKRFIDDTSNLKSFGMDKPTTTITMSFRDSEKVAPLTLQFAAVTKDKNTNHFLRINQQGTIYELEHDVLSKLPKGVAGFREKQLLRFPTNNAVQIDFNLYKAQAITLLKSNNEWFVNGKKGDQTFIADLIRNLSDLKADGFPTDNRDYGFKNPRLKAIIRIQDGAADNKKSTERVLVVGDSADGNKKTETRYYAAVDDLKEPFIITKEDFKNIFPREEVLVKVEEKVEDKKIEEVGASK